MVRICKIKQLFVALSACSILLLYVAFDQDLIQKQISPQSSSDNNTSICASKKCLILFWIHEELEFKIPDHPLCGGGCEITRNRARLVEASAIIIEMKWLTDFPKPELRTPHQVYIWFCTESTWTSVNYYKYPFKKYDNYFNWTMSFRVDSDVDGFMMPFTAIPFVNYMLKKRYENESINVFSDQRYEIVKSSAEICENSIKKHPTPMPDVTKKSKLAIWMAKDCDEIKGAITRVKIVKDLIAKGLEVGGNSRCLPKNKSHPIKQSFMPMAEFFEMISAHKFYLAFENTYHCKGYITEKFWLNALYAGAVPVVYGARKEDFNRLAPPNSFIHYDDFATSQELVNYLKYLDKNDTAYMEYFEWRKLYPCDYPLHTKDDEEYQYSTKTRYAFLYNTYCNLCKMLRKGTFKPKTITSLKDFWFGPESEECLNT